MLKQADFDNADSMWENYGADFIKENGEWKIWHLHMYTDFQCEFGASIPIPMPYASWDFSAPNYGVTIEQYESPGIDVNDWYAAHS